MAFINHSSQFISFFELLGDLARSHTEEIMKKTTPIGSYQTVDVVSLNRYLFYFYKKLICIFLNDFTTEFKILMRPKTLRFQNNSIYFKHNVQRFLAR